MDMVITLVTLNSTFITVFYSSNKNLVHKRSEYHITKFNLCVVPTIAWQDKTLSSFNHIPQCNAQSNIHHNLNRKKKKIFKKCNYKLMAKEFEFNYLVGELQIQFLWNSLINVPIELFRWNSYSLLYKGKNEHVLENSWT